ncbi:hypothetical protein A8H39_00220 [Paraburkholderia fungorum]|uniref:DUF7007 domain-containing protein n=1 Tax=Paraburkholderia fungorum TaxID=134537 RepID=UPI0006976294|nr:hypothetical protein [Paraburkholderia fungorum]PNE59608.1 hypothetical protein A8H39_00220 [Paraburkholderia fungorum]
MNTTMYPKHSPWGAPHSISVVAEGIVRYTTGSHGGYWLSPERVAAMPAGLRPMQHLDGDGSAWFEEDQEWAIVELAFPRHFDAKGQEAARKLLIDWMPDIWEAWTGEKLAPESSYTRRLAAFFEKHQNDQIVTGAYGSWDKRVPKGMVGVVALTGGRSPKGQLHGPESCWLVDEKEYGDAYKQPGYLGYFVIDPARHQPWSREVLAAAA